MTGAGTNLHCPGPSGRLSLVGSPQGLQAQPDHIREVCSVVWRRRHLGTASWHAEPRREVGDSSRACRSGSGEDSVGRLAEEDSSSAVAAGAAKATGTTAVAAAWDKTVPEEEQSWECQAAEGRIWTGSQAVMLEAAGRTFGWLRGSQVRTLILPREQGDLSQFAEYRGMSKGKFTCRGRSAWRSCKAVSRLYNHSCKWDEGQSATTYEDNTG